MEVTRIKDSDVCWNLTKLHTLIRVSRVAHVRLRVAVVAVVVVVAVGRSSATACHQKGKTKSVC